MMRGTRPAPASDCPLCPRLVQFRETNREAQPGWHNAPVGSFGAASARLLIVGLAPGRRGANRTGRPFTGDYAGELLYRTLLRFGLARGCYEASPDDGLELIDCRIVNAVRCVPPQNRPIGSEIVNCRQFLQGEILSQPAPKVVLPLGSVAHASTLRVLGLREDAYPFRHAALYRLNEDRVLAPSYHCSRQNLNTRRLTPAMFEAVFEQIRPLISSSA
jgi:uracil-DNA glycosylase family 4